MNPSLPIDEVVPAVANALDRHGAAVLVAPPGSGKTTRVSPGLLAAGPVLVLQPRRVAARAIAERIAAEQGTVPGEDVGWQVRFERRFSARTRLLVVTEGILTRRLQDDPLLGGFATVVLDEFHERTVHADLALALLRQARLARPDLRVLVMSATLDPVPVSRFLGDCPVVQVAGRPHPVDVRHAPHASAASAARDALREAPGHVLVFLAGAPEIRRVQEELGPMPPGVTLLPLHGSLPGDEQARALQPAPGRKLILATNVAETSLTIDGVTDVVDTGLHKVLRHDPATGLDRLHTERIGVDSAEQRAGRAGRTGPGRAVRLWDPRDQLAAGRQPELQRVDLAGPLLDVAGWGGDPTAFEWFEAPPADAVARAVELLQRLGALDGTRRLTSRGRELQRLPLHPRLGSLLLADGGSRRAAAACAFLSEGQTRLGQPRASASDLLTLADTLSAAPSSVRQAARQLEQLTEGRAAASDEETFLRAVLAAWPDRVARRRDAGSDRLLLASGTGARLARESGVSHEFLVAVEVTGARPGERAEALVRLASGVERDWLRPDRVERTQRFDAEAGVVRASERTMLGAVVLSERAVPPDVEEAAALLAREWQRAGLDEDDQLLLRRASFAGVELGLENLLATACAGLTRLPGTRLQDLLPWDVRTELDRLAPPTLGVPSGRRVALEYRDDGTVLASVKLQELFGLGESPRVGPRREAVVFALLSPGGRPVQTTRDLASFWRTTYAEVRKELRGRYPRHPWPEDPATATPTARTKKRA